MSNGKLVAMKVTREYPRGGIVRGVGETIHVTEAVANAMEEARPPYGERVADKSSAPPSTAPQRPSGAVTAPSGPAKD